MDNLLEFIFKPACYFCKTRRGMFCESCLSTVTPLTYRVCIICDKYSRTGLTHSKCQIKGSPETLISVFEYEGLARDCIRVSKYNSMIFNTLKKLTLYSIGFLTIEDLLELKKCDVIIGIPVSRSKLKMRGFNHVDKITGVLSSHFKIKEQKSILIRKKDTKSQYKQDRLKRFENLENAFAVANSQKSKLFGKTVLVVDDVCTTGATLVSASKTLIEAGAAKVICFTLCKKSRMLKPLEKQPVKRFRLAE